MSELPLVYECNKCQTITRLSVRDKGAKPEKLYCQIKGCGGKAELKTWFVVSDEPVLLELILPQNQKDWDRIRETTERSIRELSPKMKERRIKKYAEKILSKIKPLAIVGQLIPVYIEKDPNVDS